MFKKALLLLPVAAVMLTACEKKEATKKIERCIDQICEKVAYYNDKLYINATLNIHSKDNTSVKARNGYLIEIPAVDAIEISKNWDYNNMKLYTNTDGKLNEHEKDACDTLYKLNLYITSHDLEIVHQYE